MAEFEFTQREIPYGQNPNYSDGKDLDTSKFRPSGQNQDAELKKLLEKSNMSKSADDGVTSNKVNTGIDDLDLREFSTKFTSDIIYKKIDSGVGQIGDFKTEDNLGDGGVENLNTQTLADGSFFDSFNKAIGRSAISSIPGFNTVSNIVNMLWQREPEGLNKAMIGVDGLKEKAANRKLIPNAGMTRLNDNENFPLGLLESNRFGALHTDEAVGFLQSKKSDTSKISGFLKNIGLDIASNSLGLLNSVTGVNIGGEINFWKNSEAVDQLTAKEIMALQSVNMVNIYNEKPGTYIKPMNDDEFKKDYLEKVFFDTSANDILYNTRFNPFSIGRIYVEPYFNKQNIEVFSIPFQFNPEISEGSLTAEYATEKILGRITAARYYINTDSGATTIKTKYIATNQNHDVDIINGKTRKNYRDLDSEWYEYWTPEKIREIEYKYRSLVFPTRDGEYLVKPPIIQVYIENEQLPTIANVLAYPIAQKGEILNDGSGEEVSKDSYVTYTNKPVFEHTKSFKDSITTASGGEGTPKRFIVTEVKIEDLENTNGWNYDYVEGYKRGFSVSITLAETTRNFLDQVPDFKAYYDAFINSNQVDSNYYNEYGSKYSDLTGAADVSKDHAKAMKDLKTAEEAASEKKAAKEAAKEEKKQKEKEKKQKEKELREEKKRIGEENKRIEEENKVARKKLDDLNKRNKIAEDKGGIDTSSLGWGKNGGEQAALKEIIDNNNKLIKENNATLSKYNDAYNNAVSGYNNAKSGYNNARSAYNDAVKSLSIAMQNPNISVGGWY